MALGSKSCGGFMVAVMAVLSSTSGSSGKCAWVGMARAGGGRAGAGGIWYAVMEDSSGACVWPCVGMCMVVKARSEHLCGSRGQGWLWTPAKWLLDLRAGALW